MARWEPGAHERLQASAMTLFQQRGYDEVTVAEIAAEAGLTRRTFFNHFADKREIFFSGAAAFLAGVMAHLHAVDPSLEPFEAACAALTGAGIDIGDYRHHAPAVRALVESANELRERELSKMAAVTDALAAGLERRGADARTALLAASSAVTAYRTAWQDWGERPNEQFADLMERASADLLKAVGRVRQPARRAGRMRS